MTDDTAAKAKSRHPRARTHTWTEWGVAWPSPYSPSGRAWDMLTYDDEDDAREHLELHGPSAFLVARQVTATLWGRA